MTQEDKKMWEESHTMNNAMWPRVCRHSGFHYFTEKNFLETVAVRANTAGVPMFE